MVFLILYLNFNRNLCRQTVENLTRCCVLSGFALFADVPQKKRLGLFGLMFYLERSFNRYVAFKNIISRLEILVILICLLE